MSVGHEELEKIIALTKSGMYEEALKRQLYFHEASKYSAGMGGVRLSYALSTWMELADKYEPAKEAMLEISDKSKKHVLENDDNYEEFSYFHDFCSINENLGLTQNILELFFKVKDINPAQARGYYHYVENLLIENKEYELCNEYIGDPIKKYIEIEDFHKLNHEIMIEQPKLNDNTFREFTRDTYIFSVCKLIEVLLATRQKNNARAVQEKALEYFDCSEIRNAINE